MRDGELAGGLLVDDRPKVCRPVGAAGLLARQDAQAGAYLLGHDSPEQQRVVGESFVLRSIQAAASAASAGKTCCRNSDPRVCSELMEICMRRIGGGQASCVVQVQARVGHREQGQSLNAAAPVPTAEPHQQHADLTFRTRGAYSAAAGTISWTGRTRSDTARMEGNVAAAPRAALRLPELLSVQCLYRR